MFIQTETTPNHNALKFLPGIFISKDETLFFENINEASSRSELAEELFKIDFVKAVFLGSDFITLTKDTNAEWDVIKPEALMVIMDYILAGRPILKELKSSFQNLNKAEKNSTSAEQSETEKKIIEIIETRVRPTVAMDGGDIIYKKFENGVVFLELHGACSGCPSATITLKQGIESMLKHFLPEVKMVKALNH